MAEPDALAIRFGYTDTLSYFGTNHTAAMHMKSTERGISFRSPILEIPAGASTPVVVSLVERCHLGEYC